MDSKDDKKVQQTSSTENPLSSLTTIQQTSSTENHSSALQTIQEV